MAAIGWIATGLTEADFYYSTHSGALTLWPGLSDEQKTAALTTAYNRIRKSKLLSIPASPTAAQLEDLVYAQEEYALHFLVLGDGGVRREATQGQGVKSAGIVKETYLDPEKVPGLPANILENLEVFKKQKPFYSVPAYRDEIENDAYDRHFDT